MAAQDAISGMVTDGTNSAGQILISNASNTCAMIGGQQQLSNGQTLFIRIGTVDGGVDSAPAAPGVFPVVPEPQSKFVTKGPIAIVWYEAKDATCTGIYGNDRPSGTITLTRGDANGYSGTFDMTFPASLSTDPPAGHITGSFDTTACAAMRNFVGFDGLTGTCK